MSMSSTEQPPRETLQAFLESEDVGSEASPSKYPQNLNSEEIEQNILASLIKNNESYEDISAFLHEDHFTTNLHKQMYRAISSLLDNNRIVSTQILRPYMDAQREPGQMSGIEYLEHIEQLSIPLIAVKDYAHNLYDLHLTRSLITISSDLYEKASHFSPNQRPMDLLEETEKKLYEIVPDNQIHNTLKPFEQLLPQSLKNIQEARDLKGKLSGVTTGFFDLNRRLNGLQKSDLLIIAGRPSMGKTALATSIAVNAAYAKMKDPQGSGANVAFFSLEMSADQLTTRILADKANIPSHLLRSGFLEEQDMTNITQVALELDKLPLYIDDTPALTLGAIRIRSRRLSRKNKLDLIVIDYLQLMRASSLKSDGNRVQEISEMTRGLKALAKELNVPIIVLSQLSRLVESREDKRPQLSDLRDSGAIEQDADVVMFVYRPEYYLERENPEDANLKESPEAFHIRKANWEEKMTKYKNIAHIIVAKQRHGPIGTETLFFDKSFTRFSNLLPQHHYPHAVTALEKKINTKQ